MFFLVDCLIKNEMFSNGNNAISTQNVLYLLGPEGVLFNGRQMDY